MAFLTTATINNRQYQHSSLELFVGESSAIFKGFKSINYSAKLSVKKMYGANRVPVGRTPGNADFDGDVEFYDSEAEEFVNQLKAINPNFLDTKFAMIINKQEEGMLTDTDVLDGCQVVEWTISSQEGESPKTTKFKLSIMNVLPYDGQTYMLAPV